MGSPDGSGGVSADAHPRGASSLMGADCSPRRVTSPCRPGVGHLCASDAGVAPAPGLYGGLDRAHRVARSALAPLGSLSRPDAISDGLGNALCGPAHGGGSELDRGFDSRAPWAAAERADRASWGIRRDLLRDALKQALGLSFRGSRDRASERARLRERDGALGRLSPRRPSLDSAERPLNGLARCGFAAACGADNSKDKSSRADGAAQSFASLIRAAAREGAGNVPS